MGLDLQPDGLATGLAASWAPPARQKYP